MQEGKSSAKDEDDLDDDLEDDEEAVDDGPEDAGGLVRDGAALRMAKVSVGVRRRYGIRTQCSHNLTCLRERPWTG